MIQKTLIICLAFFILVTTACTLKQNRSVSDNKNFTIIPAANHNLIQTDQDITNLITTLDSHKSSSFNNKVALAAQYFENKPTRLPHIEGEGDLCPGTYDQHGCPHIQQDPIYRTDVFACNTLVQIVLASVSSNNLPTFKKNILKIEYGAANEPATSVHYYNRNNFISADFNPVNQRQGFIIDATRTAPFINSIKTTSTTIDRENWFHHQMRKEELANSVRVLSANDGSAMLERTKKYPEKFHHFVSEKVSIEYIPKEVFEKKINQLPTPSIVEIVRDSSKWQVGGKNISQIAGSGINVSHLGLAYRQIFKKGEVIFQRINCAKQEAVKICRVTPVICQKKKCQEVIFTHATMMYPDGFVYSKDRAGQYHCSAKAARGNTVLGSCNRVISMPLREYVMMEQYGRRPFMESVSILGIHVEVITPPLNPV